MRAILTVGLGERDAPLLQQRHRQPRLETRIQAREDRYIDAITEWFGVHDIIRVSHWISPLSSSARAGGTASGDGHISMSRSSGSTGTIASLHLPRFYHRNVYVRFRASILLMI